MLCTFFCLDIHLSIFIKGVEIVEHEYKNCECENARTLVSCPGKQRIFLVVCAKFFQIFDASDFTILCHTAVSNSEETYSSGYFIDIDKIVICLVDGTTHVYQLPEKFVIFYILSSLLTRSQKHSCLITPSHFYV